MIRPHRAGGSGLRRSIAMTGWRSRSAAASTAWCWPMWRTVFRVPTLSPCMQCQPPYRRPPLPRVEAHARRSGWRLRLIDAGELADPALSEQPRRPLFFFARPTFTPASAPSLACRSPPVPTWTTSAISGPASKRRAGTAWCTPSWRLASPRTDIYALARAYALDDLAALPAQPCLASRIETGIGVDEATLNFIEAAEAELTLLLPTERALALPRRAHGRACRVRDAAGRRRAPARRRSGNGNLRSPTAAGSWACALYRRGAAFLPDRPRNERIRTRLAA